jgi:uncharacterized protein
MVISVTGLEAYPVKSLRGHNLERADVRAEGFAGDRRWMLVDANNRFLTQRELPAMATLDVLQLPGALEIVHADAGHIHVTEPGSDAAIADVVVWRDTVKARRASPDAEAWLSGVLGRNVRLVHMHDVRARPSSSSAALPGDHVSFADGFPILITSTASLENLNERGQRGLGVSGHIMRQFRANLVVSGAPPWAEDTWQRIRIGTVTLRIAKPCARCVITTLDPETGMQLSPEEPLRTLGKFHRAADGGIIFGQNAVAQSFGTIAVGDPIEVLEAGRSNVVPRTGNADPFSR